MSFEADPHTLPLGERVRPDFPIFQGKNHKLAYLDSAASAQKPRAVIDKLAHYYSFEHANIHRGAYTLSAEATRMYEEARARVGQFLNAPETSIVFIRGATEGVNLVAYALEDFFQAGDTIVLTELEHHSNIVPWQLLAERKGLELYFARVTSDGDLDYEHLRELLERFVPKLVSITMLSNAIGTQIDTPRVRALTKKQGSLLLVDGAQAVCHTPVNVEELEVDFLVFSGHKLYGPTGIGALYIKPECYPHMKPFLGGGDMIKEVTTNGSTWAEPPQKFEAGTPPIAQAIGLKVAIDYISQFSWAEIQKHERMLMEHAMQSLSEIEGLQVVGPGVEKQVSIISFVIDGVHPHDLATIADSCHVQIRAGHHCAMPLLKALKVPATARLSLGLYSTKDDIDMFCEAIHKAKKMLS